MEFRKTVESDIDRIMMIIKQAQLYFKQNGIDQWQDNYPNRQTFKQDIANGCSYVLEKEGKIIGTSVISFDEEVTYRNIYDGQWLSTGDSAVIHRLAVDSQYKGLGISSVIMKQAERMCAEKHIHSIKVDTHEENMPMQRLLEKNGFTYCGVIYLQNNSKRVAFEKII
ncbi:GNAT family N-acetyltransferase [Bacillus testis]|uniref:GNAT family N-acetyltransferase n=1 Tax=Bacillus testis TaxID=1622072 RepID=UPI00067ED462|nr:GNAT family N-acetyltransferase [Bacillus testis]